jgi:hypothetical protein
MFIILDLSDINNFDFGLDHISILGYTFHLSSKKPNYLHKKISNNQYNCKYLLLYSKYYIQNKFPTIYGAFNMLLHQQPSVSKVARLIIYGIVRLERKKVLMATDDIV